jgi:hypothetical protein
VYPAPTPAPSGAPAEFEVGVLEAGHYALNTFQPNMEMTVGAGWFARRNWVDGWSIARPEIEGSELDAGRIQVGLSGPCGTEGEVTLGAAPNDVVDWLASRPDLQVRDPRAVNLGGYPGIEVDVIGIPGQACADYPDDPSWQLFYLGDDAAGLGQGESVRISTVDVNGRSVSFMIFSFANEIDRFSQWAAPVIASFNFPGN